jgi:hypothetical protein
MGHLLIFGLHNSPKSAKGSYRSFSVDERATCQNIEMAIALAKTVNPSVAIYKAYPTPRDFGLNFEKIS